MPRQPQTFYDYYWGTSREGAPSFRADINRVVPPDRKRSHAEDPAQVVFLLSLLFKDGPSSFMRGRRRNKFLISLYFTVLIDQGMHCYYGQYHVLYDQLTAPPKLCTTIDNVDPSFLFRADFGWSKWTKSRLVLFKEAEEVFRAGFMSFVAKHMSELDAHEAWRKFCRHLPSEARARDSE